MAEGMTASQESKHCVIHNKLKALASAVEQLKDLADKVEQGNVPKSAPDAPKDNLQTITLCSVLNQTPEILDQMTDKIVNEVNRLENFLF